MASRNANIPTTYLWQYANNRCVPVRTERVEGYLERKPKKTHRLATKEEIAAHENRIRAGANASPAPSSIPAPTPAPGPKANVGPEELDSALFEMSKRELMDTAKGLGLDAKRYQNKHSLRTMIRTERARRAGFEPPEDE